MFLQISHLLKESNVVSLSDFRNKKEKEKLQRKLAKSHDISADEYRNALRNLQIDLGLPER
jgi:predicted transcriptional regulator